MIAPEILRRVLRPDDADWPRALDDLDPAPERLRIAGRLPDLDRAVAIVGTRAAETEALDFAYDLAGDLSRAGCPIVSGGARGIDAAAHEGALAAGGTTVAFLATGLRVPYPPEHRDLFARIVANGAIVSEHGDDTPPRAGRFLERNRLIAALARAVVVVQAPARSGALSTAAWAARLERAVFVVPQAPWEPRGAGCLALLARGAAVCTRARDVLSVAAPEPRGTVPGPVRKSENTKDSSDLDADGRRVLDAIGARARYVDEVVRRSAIPVDRVQRALLGLLLLGEIEERGPGRYGPCGRRPKRL
jgi:DNA processing protein